MYELLHREPSGDPFLIKEETDKGFEGMLFDITETIGKGVPTEPCQFRLRGFALVFGQVVLPEFPRLFQDGQQDFTNTREPVKNVFAHNEDMIDGVNAGPPVV